MLRLILLCFCILALQNVNAQQTFQKILTDPRVQAITGVSKRIIHTNDGGYAFMGSSRFYMNGSYADYTYVAKLDAANNLQWVKNFNTKLPNDYETSMCQTKDSGIVVTTTSSIFKIDTKGKLLWNKLTEWNDNFTIRSIIETYNRDLVLVGERYNGYDNMVFMLKLDSAGNYKILREYKPSENSLDNFITLHSVIEIENNNYIFCGGIGRTESLGNRGGILLFKTNAYGDIKWSKTIKWNTYENFGAIKCIKTLDGGFALAGGIGEGEYYTSDMYMVKLDTGGNVQWSAALGKKNIGDDARSIVETSDNGFALVGSGGNNRSDEYLAKISQQGELVWAKTIGAKRDEAAWDVIEHQNSLIVVGQSSSFEGYMAQSYIIKTDAAGNICSSDDQTGTIILTKRSEMTEPYELERLDIRKIIVEPGIDAELIDYGSFLTICEDVVLPLHILSFTATNKNGNNILNWHTEQEENTKSFGVERSEDATTFYKIGAVTAKNNFKNDYSYTDIGPISGTNYYRLRITNNAGIASYSDIKTVKNGESFYVNISPNPVKGSTATIKISGANSNINNLYIVSAEGKIIQSKKINAVSGTVTEIVNVTSLAKGLYYLKVTSGEYTKVVKFIIE